MRKIKQEMVFPADMLRDSYETLEVRNILNDSLNEEEKSEMSIFDEINIIDCDRTIRAKSDLTGSEYRLDLAEVPSGLDLDKTVRLSIEHCINFDIRDSNAILKAKGRQETLRVYSEGTQGQIGGKMSQHSHSMSSLRKASISAPHHSQTGLL